jgi:hypothetical protein
MFFPKSEVYRLKLVKAISRYAILFISLLLLGGYLYCEFFDQNTAALIRLRLVEFGTFLSGVGTVAAVYVAYLALSNWKHQSKGESTLKRLLACQEKVSILCCEFLARTTSSMGQEKEELYEIAKSLDRDLAILSRQIHPNDEILTMKQLLLMPKVRIRDHGMLWDDEKEKLLALEGALNKYIASR